MTGLHNATCSGQCIAGMGVLLLWNSSINFGCFILYWIPTTGLTRNNCSLHNISPGYYCPAASVSATANMCPSGCACIFIFMRFCVLIFLLQCPHNCSFIHLLLIFLRTTDLSVRLVRVLPPRALRVFISTKYVITFYLKWCRAFILWLRKLLPHWFGCGGTMSSGYLGLDDGSSEYDVFGSVHCRYGVFLRSDNFVACSNRWLFAIMFIELQ